MARGKWQMAKGQNYSGSSRSQEAAGEIKNIEEANDDVELVEANVRFTRADIEDQNTLFRVIYVQKKKGKQEVNTSDIKSLLTKAVQEGLLQEGYNVVPLVDIVVLEPPP